MCPTALDSGGNSNSSCVHCPQLGSFFRFNWARIQLKLNQNRPDVETWLAVDSILFESSFTADVWVQLDSNFQAQDLDSVVVRATTNCFLVELNSNKV